MEGGKKFLAACEWSGGHHRNFRNILRFDILFLFFFFFMTSYIVSSNKLGYSEFIAESLLSQDIILKKLKIELGITYHLN